MGKLRDNLNLIFSNLLFGANFSIYVSLVRNWFDFRQLFLLQVGAAALFFIPFALLVAPHAPYALGRSEKHPDRDGADYLRLDVHDAVGRDLHQSRRRIDSGHAGAGLHAADRRRDAPRAFSWVRTLGVAAALCGAGHPLFERGFHLVEGSEGWGNALVLIAVLSIAANTVIIKPQLQRFGTLWVMGWYYLIGVAITFPFFKDYIDLNRLYTLPPAHWPKRVSC